MELFRILSTVLVVIVHWVGAFPTLPAVYVGGTTQAVGQAIWESISIMCVNCFLAITGWYGLRLRWRHVVSIWSVVAFIYVPFYLLDTALYGHFEWLTLLDKCVGLLHTSYYVQAYLLLMLLSPMLNLFIREYRSRLGAYALALWVVEIVFGWLTDAKCMGFGRGYHVMHFVTIYLLMQALRQHSSRVRSAWCVWVLLGSILATWIIYVTGGQNAFCYANPFTVTAAAALFLLFERRSFYSRWINMVAAGSLTAFLMHMTKPCFGWCKSLDLWTLYHLPYWLYIVVMIGVALGIVWLGAAYNQLRRVVMGPLERWLIGARIVKIIKNSVG